MTPLYVFLATAPYRRFEAGIKTVEVRQHLGRWNERVVHTGRPVILCRGYNTPDRLARVINRVAYATSVPDLPLWAKEGAHLGDVQAARYFDPHKPVLAFEVLP